MAVEQSGFYERDEPEFDLGFGLDPAGMVGDELDGVVAILNGLQESADSQARGQLARVQTGINLVQNQLRRDIDGRLERPSVDVIELQERIAVDSAGRMADAGERFNALVRQIADSDDATTRCLVACRRRVVECQNMPEAEKPQHRAECEQLLIECVQRCRGELLPERPPPPERPIPPRPIPGGKPTPGEPPQPPERPQPPSRVTGQVQPEGTFTEIPVGCTVDTAICGWDDRWHGWFGNARYRGHDANQLPTYFGMPTSKPLQPGYVASGLMWYPPGRESEAPQSAVYFMAESDRHAAGAVRWEMGFAIPYLIAPLCCHVAHPVPVPPEEPAPEEPPADEEEPEVDYDCVPMCPPPVPEGEPTCALYFDCELRQVYGLLIPAGAEAEPRHEGDLQIGATGVNQAKFDELRLECSPEEEEGEDGEEDEDDVADIGPGMRPGPDNAASLCSYIAPAAIWTTLGESPNALCSLFGVQRDADGNLQTPSWIVELPRWVQYLVGGSNEWLFKICTDISKWVSDWFSTTASGSVLANEIFLSRWFVYIVGLLAGPAVENWEISLRQQFNYQNPVLVPTADNAVEAYLAHNINEEQAKCWIQANDYSYTDYQHVVRARRSKLGVNELIQLRLRDSLTPGEFNQRVRQLGFINPDEPPAFMELSKWIPGPQDLIRWMVRDVEDDNIVQRFGLDDLFTEKFAGHVEEYAKWQNIDPDDMLRVWRAHWLIPSPQQLYQMYHRLRHDDIPDNQRVTLDDIQTALQQQDIAPFWIDRHLAIAFRPLTRVDVRRAFRIGALDRNQAIRAYYDLGYSDKNATILVDFAEQLVTNTWLRTPWVKKMASGEITEGEARHLMASEGAGQQYIDKGVQRARLLRDSDTRKKCIASLRRRYLEGEFDQIQVNAEVMALGLDQPMANSLVDGWKCELESQGKHAPAAALCAWWMEGIIDSAEYIQRLQNLGYDHDTALHFMAQCEVRNDRKLAKEEKARIHQLEVERKKIEAERNRQAKQIEQQQKSRDRANDKAAKVRQRRQDLMVEAAKRLANRFGDDIVLTMREVKATHSAMKSLISWPEASIIKAIVQASQLKEVESLDQYGSAVLAILQELPVRSVSGNGNGDS